MFSLVNRLIRFDAMRGYREQQKQRRKPICRSSARRLHPLIEDYPKMYHKQEIKDMGMYGNIASYFKGRSDYGTREHSYYEHDNRAAVGSEEYIKSNPSPSKKRKAEEQKRREDARKEAEERLFDPLDFELPQMFLMGSDVWNPLDYPRSTVVRAGASHREDLFATVYEVARKQGRDQVEFPAAFMERIDASKDPYLAEDIFPGSSLGGLKQKPSDTFSFGPKDALYGTEGPTVHSKTRGKSFRPVGGISSTNVNKKQPTKAIAGSSATASLPAKGKASAPKRPLGIATRDEDIWDHEGTEYENNLELGPLWNCFARYEGDDIAPSKRCAEHDVGTSPTRKLPRRTRGD